MALITMMGGSLAYGDDALLQEADFALEEGERVCLVGRNGTGKSSLLKVLAGVTELDAGPIIEQDIVRITHKDTVADLIHKGRDLEKIVLSRAVEKHIQRKILSYRNKTIVFS